MLLYFHDWHYHTDMAKLTPITQSNSLQIKTPQELIHIEHRISLLQYKYWILLLREYKRQFDLNIPDEDGWRYLSLASISEAIGYLPNKKELWNDLQALKNQTIAYNFLNKDGSQAKRGAGFITEWEVHNTRVGFKFPSFIAEVVKGLDAPKAIFQMLNWQIFNAFSKKYEAIIYKLCRDYRGVNKTPMFTLQSFRKYMGLEESEYSDFRDLNKVCISGPVKAINASEVSDLIISVEFERHGRKVVGLQFWIESKQKSFIPFDDIGESPAFRMAKAPIGHATQKKYLEQRTPEEIEQCIARANEYGEQQAKRGKAPNLGALYCTAIKDGWHTTLIAKQSQKEDTEKRRQEARLAIEAKEAEDAARNAAIRNQTDEAIAVFDSLPAEQKDDIREAFRSTLTVPTLRKSFDKSHEKSKVVRMAFADFFREHHMPIQSQKKQAKAGKK